MTQAYVQRRRPYIRNDRPLSLTPTERDLRILETIHNFDGLLSLKQIDRLFFSGMGRTQPRQRMRRLFDAHLVNMPQPSQIHKVPLGETIYFLDERGAAELAGLYGVTLRDFKWRRQPRWALIKHDLAVNDFRIAVSKASETMLDIKLNEWVPESEFWIEPDAVDYRTCQGIKKRRVIIPDGFFTIWRRSPQQIDRLEQLAFLLEIDRATEDNPRFSREKVRPGVAYLRSRAYEKRFGVSYGCYLVVTTGERRMHNLKSHSERNGGNGRFYFTTFAKAANGNVLTEPIWQLAGSNMLFSIDSLPLSPFEAGIIEDVTHTRRPVQPPMFAQ